MREKIFLGSYLESEEKDKKSSFFPEKENEVPYCESCHLKVDVCPFCHSDTFRKFHEVPFSGEIGSPLMHFS